jgi:hypothetical protein
MLDAGYLMLDTKRRMAQGARLLDAGCWMNILLS